MDLTWASLLVIALALVGANLPFFTSRVFGVIAWRAARKPFWLRLIELCIYYAVVLLAARALESSLGNAFPQRWEFFAVTGCLFLVFAYPGYVWRYMRKSHDLHG